MFNSKNRYFYHIFVSPGDAPGAITLYVVRMGREFDAYNLSHCTCDLTITVFEIQRDICGKKSSFYHTPLHSTPPLGGFSRNIGTPFGTEKLEWCRYPKVKKFWRYVYSFWRDPRTWQTDRRTDRQTDTAWQQRPRLCIASRGKNVKKIKYTFWSKETWWRAE